jgi:hypothetical protein
MPLTLVRRQFAIAPFSFDSFCVTPVTRISAPPAVHPVEVSVPRFARDIGWFAAGVANIDRQRLHISNHPRQRTAARSYVMAEDKKDYDIGYCKPPVHTRFPKGRSPNPRGRPKASQNIRASFEAAMQEKVGVTDKKGRQKQITRNDLFFKQVWNRAISGHGPSQRIVVQLLMLRDAKADKRTEPFVFYLSEADSKL